MFSSKMVKLKLNRIKKKKKSILIDSRLSVVKNTQEAVLDSRFLVLASDLNSQKTQSIQIGEDTEINLDELVAKIITASSEGPNHREGVCLDWELLGQRASTFGKRIHGMDFMLGPLSVQRKEIRKSKAVRLTKNKSDLVTPTQVKKKKIEII